jgi:transposase-like protein
MHEADRKRKITGTGIKDKTAVMGLLERDGEVRAMIVPNTRKASLQPRVREHVESGSAVFSDAHHSYTGLGEDYDHRTIDHAIEYVRGQVHTNGIENFWALLKRGLGGTYVGVAPFHLFRYLDEQVYRFNKRKANDLTRFTWVLGAVSGRRLSYRGLIGRS